MVQCFRFSVEDTRNLFLVMFAVPASLWVFSCSCLFGCSKVLRVEETGQMRIRYVCYQHHATLTKFKNIQMQVQKKEKEAAA